MTATFAEALAARTQDVLDRCTRCGRCFEACPTKVPAGLADKDAKAVTGGVLDIIRGGNGTAEALRWAQVCSGSGCCIPACPEAINPRFMLALARTARQRRATAEEQREKGNAAFSKMGRSVRVLSRMQLPADVLMRFRHEAPAQSRPEVVFYTGCNVLRTPHIVLLSLDILDALGVSYRVMGGPGNKRVGLHEHPGLAGVCESATRILQAIPGLDYVELEQPQVGYMCNTLQPLPLRSARLITLMPESEPTASASPRKTPAPSARHLRRPRGDDAFRNCPGRHGSRPRSGAECAPRRPW